MARPDAKLLVTGFVQGRPDGRVTFGCYVYDVAEGPRARPQGFVAAPDDWRRAAHKCSGLAYKAATGAPGIFDTRIAYVAESGVGDGRVKPPRDHGQRRRQPPLPDQRARRSC